MPGWTHLQVLQAAMKAYSSLTSLLIKYATDMRLHQHVTNNAHRIPSAYFWCVCLSSTCLISGLLGLTPTQTGIRPGPAGADSLSSSVTVLLYQTVSG